MKKLNTQIGAIAYNKTILNGRSGGRLLRLLEKLENFEGLETFDQLLQEIMETAREVMETEASSLMLLDEDTGELVVKQPTGPVKDEIQDARIPPNKGYGGWVVNHRIPLIDNDITDNSALHWGELSEKFETRNLICAPLINKEDKVIGVIQAVNRYGSEGFASEDLPIFQELGKHAARAIEFQRSRTSKGTGLGRQELLVSELHHRVKNNLALISGMVEMESDKIRDSEARNVLKKIQSRVKSINVVYELLSGKGEYEAVGMSEYLRELIESISSAFESPIRDIRVEVNTDRVSVKPDKALSCGLIINELMVNSYKYAFKYKNEGKITIDLSATDDHRIVLKYQDNGIGMPPDFDPDEYASMGFQIIHTLAKQLDGSFSFDKKNGYKGVRCTLTFPIGKE